MEAVERIRVTINDVGVSITLTTLTSTLAFAMGCVSDIPAVRWLCLYAFPSVLMVYFYQLTFFVACIVLDENRIKDRRMDVCCCVRVPLDDEEKRVEEDKCDENSEKALQNGEQNDASPKLVDQYLDPGESGVDRFMAHYGEVLTRPRVKIGVVVGFTILTAVLAVSASKLRQEFSFQDVLPADSYLADYLDATSDHGNLNQLQPGVYFRNEDQSDPAVRRQMKDFIKDLQQLDAVSGGPDFCWLFEFENFVNNSTFIQNLEFNDQLGFFLGVPDYARLYRPEIRLRSSGSIRSSRCKINLYNVDMEDVADQIDTLADLKRVASSQPINEGKVEQSFFTSLAEYNTWEFYTQSVDELILTAVLGIVSVTIIAFILVPHWTASPTVFPLMCLLYMDLLGVLQWGGIAINAVSYVTLVMAIGLMVDFIMHVLVRYYEAPGNRREKTIEMLRTMGSSVLIGGISTFLGTCPLLFSTSDIFKTVFVAFVGLVTLGVGHGLILLPVILSTIGTEEQIPAPGDRADVPNSLSQVATEDDDSESSVDERNGVSHIVGQMASEEFSEELASEADTDERNNSDRPDPPEHLNEDVVSIFEANDNSTIAVGVIADERVDQPSDAPVVTDVENQYDGELTGGDWSLEHGIDESEENDVEEQVRVVQTPMEGNQDDDADGSCSIAAESDTEERDDSDHMPVADESALGEGDMPDPIAAAEETDEQVKTVLNEDNSELIAGPTRVAYGDSEPTASENDIATQASDEPAVLEDVPVVEAKSQDCPVEQVAALSGLAYANISRTKSEEKKGDSDSDDSDGEDLLSRDVSVLLRTAGETEDAKSAEIVLTASEDQKLGDSDQLIDSGELLATPDVSVIFRTNGTSVAIVSPPSPVKTLSMEEVVLMPGNITWADSSEEKLSDTEHLRRSEQLLMDSGVMLPRETSSVDEEDKRRETQAEQDLAVGDVVSGRSVGTGNFSSSRIDI